MQQAESTRSAELRELEPAAVMDEVQAYCQRALERSRFFNLLAANNLDPGTLKYVFGQFYLWRNIFHTWFGFAIEKSGTCALPEAKEAILSLAEHIVIETKDHHDLQYLKFLFDLGFSSEDVEKLEPNAATRIYSASFFKSYQYRDHVFFEMVAAIAGREMLASMRNAHAIKTYFLRYGIQAKPWWGLHEEVEYDHFHSEIGPVLKVWRQTDRPAADLYQPMWTEIDRHMEYWDELLSEATSRSLAAE